ncbi:hypothetical protein [Crossiella equi]|nr:hypothetical protein [Crossiella equi]
MRPAVALLLGVLYLALHLGGECFVTHTPSVAHAAAHDCHHDTGGHHDLPHDSADQLCLAVPRGEDHSPLLDGPPPLVPPAPVDVTPAVFPPTPGEPPAHVLCGQSIQLVNCVFRT